MCFRQLLRWLRLSKPTYTEIMHEVERQLDEWLVDMYAKNPHLVKIPRERIIAQEQVIYNQLLNEWRMN